MNEKHYRKNLCEMVEYEIKHHKSVEKCIKDRIRSLEVLKSHIKKGASISIIENFIENEVYYMDGQMVSDELCEDFEEELLDEIYKYTKNI